MRSSTWCAEGGGRRRAPGGLRGDLPRLGAGGERPPDGGLPITAVSAPRRKAHITVSPTGDTDMCASGNPHGKAKSGGVTTGDIATGDTASGDTAPAALWGGDAEERDLRPRGVAMSVSSSGRATATGEVLARGIRAPAARLRGRRGDVAFEPPGCGAGQARSTEPWSTVLTAAVIVFSTANVGRS
jgi:hypothetical protein